MQYNLTTFYTIKPEWVLRKDINYHTTHTLYNVITNKHIVISPALYAIVKILYYNAISLGELHSFVFEKSNINLDMDIINRIENEHQVELLCKSEKSFHFYDNYFQPNEDVLECKVPTASTPIDAEIHFTHSCNLCCLHCFQSSSPTSDINDKHLKVNEWIDIFRQFEYLKINNVIISGGEPLYYKGAKEILKSVLNMPLSIYILTNGLLIDDEYLEIFKQKNIKLNISLDGYRKETHEVLRGKNTFIRTEQKLKNLLSQNSYVTISHTIHKKNYKEIESFVLYLIDLGIHEISFGFIEEQGRAELNNYLLLSLEDELSCLKKLKEIRNTYSSKIEIDFPTLSLIQNAPDYGNGDIVYCSAGTRRIAISSDGKLYPCISAFGNRDLEIGNLRKEKILDIWNDERRWYFFRGGININEVKACSDCSLNKACSFRNCRIKYYNDVDKLFAKPKNCMLDKTSEISFEEIRELIL